MRFGVLAAETMEFTVMWYVKSCSLIVMYQYVRWARILQGVTSQNLVTDTILLACFILLFFLTERKQAYLKTMLCVLPLNFWYPSSMLWALHHRNSSLCWTSGRNANLWGMSKNMVSCQRSHGNMVKDFGKMHFCSCHIVVEGKTRCAVSQLSCWIFGLIVITNQ